MIDTKRLATDAAYWRECGAPEDATHCHERESGYMWWRKVEDRMYKLRDGNWTERLFWPKSLIRRPQAPEAEWADGLPGVGVECEVMLESGKWEWCQVKAHSGSGSWIVTKTDDRVIRNDLVRWRPISTPEQREREETINAATKLMEINFASPRSLYIAYCELLYDAGLLRKQEQNK